MAAAAPSACLKRLLCAAGAAALMLLAPSHGTAAAAGAASRPAHTGWAPGLVRSPGGPYLTDSVGRRLQLHGVNLVAKCGGGARDLPVPLIASGGVLLIKRRRK